MSKRKLMHLHMLDEYFIFQDHKINLNFIRKYNIIEIRRASLVYDIRMMKINSTW